MSGDTCGRSASWGGHCWVHLGGGQIGRVQHLVDPFSTGFERCENRFRDL